MKKTLLLTLVLLVASSSLGQSNTTDAGTFYDLGNDQLFVRELGSGDPLVFLHGGPGDNHENFMPWGRELANTHQVILYDQSGAGQSTFKEKQAYTIEREVANLERLREKLNLETMTLVGHSWGSILSLYYAQQYPDRVSRIVLMGSIGTSYQDYQAFAANLMSRMTPVIQSKLMQLQTAESIDMQAMFQAMLPLYFYDVDKIKDMSDTQIQFDVQQSIARQVMLEFDFSKDGAAFTMPIYVVQGEHDPLSPTLLEERFATFTNAKVLGIPEAGHWPFVEQPKATTQAILELLKN